MSDVSLIYATFPDEQTAKSIAHNIVAARLAACVNILPPVTSIYEWDGKIEESHESAVLFKTTSQQAAALIDRLKELHPYEVPAIVGWPADTAYAPFANWITAQTN